MPFSLLTTLARNPRRTGALFPSSRFLAQKMARYVPLESDGLIIELGAGTGPVTQAILNRSINPNRLISFEIVPQLAAQLQKKFPSIRVIPGDAAQLSKWITPFEKPVDVIISSLPLRSFSKTLRDSILDEILKSSSHQTRYVQFTYDLRHPQTYYSQGYMLLESSYVWLNLPPARVDVLCPKKLEKS